MKKSAEYEKNMGYEIKKESAMPLSQYIADVRLNYAKNLIVSSSIPVKQICFKSGFNAMPHFSRSFKAKFKMSPSQMRNVAGKSKI
ncbi:MAG: helix-turn-helix transcriptional regulator [Clostridia bacterium]|nr:helix-turn-helix transcriptional regulator [Clostridia bacterium]